MMSKTIVAALVASSISFTRAVNISGYSGQNCQGASGTCTNIAPDVCCSAKLGNAGVPSGEFTGLIRSDGFLGYGGGNCGYVITRGTGQTAVCLDLTAGHGTYTGFGWYEGASKKRSAETECKGEQEIDTITFANGTAYKLDGMSTAEKVALWELGASLANSG